MQPVAKHLGSEPALAQRAVRFPHVRHDHFEQGAGQRGAQRGRAIEREELPLIEQRDSRAALRFVEVRRGHQDGDASGQELRQQLPELAPRDGIDAGRGLVEQNHARLVNQSASERELLFHAAGQAVGEPFAKGGQLHHFEEAIAPAGVVGNAMNLGEERDVLVDAEVTVKTEPLRQVADARGDLAMLFHWIETENANLAFVRVQQPTEQSNRGGLAGTVRTNEAEHFAWCN